MKKPYVPKRGDLIWENFSSSKGHEQRGRRPAVVLSPQSYNGKSGMALVVPVTSKIKDYPFEVAITIDKRMNGVALCDQLRTIDWIGRDVKFIETLPASVIGEIFAKSKALLE